MARYIELDALVAEIEKAARKYAHSITCSVAGSDIRLCGCNIIGRGFKAGAKWQKEQMMSKAIDGKVLVNGMGNPILHLWDKGRHLIDKSVKVIIIEED